MDTTHYFSGGILCGAPSSRLATHRDGVTCSACLALLPERGAQGPQLARVLDRYAALCAEDDLSTGEWSVLSLRAPPRGPRLAVAGWVRRLLEHARR